MQVELSLVPQVLLDSPYELGNGLNHNTPGMLRVVHERAKISKVSGQQMGSVTGEGRFEYGTILVAQREWALQASGRRRHPDGRQQSFERVEVPRKLT